MISKWASSFFILQCLKQLDIHCNLLIHDTDKSKVISMEYAGYQENDMESSQSIILVPGQHPWEIN
jgi:hypothetical protein